MAGDHQPQDLGIPDVPDHLKVDPAKAWVVSQGQRQGRSPASLDDDRQAGMDPNRVGDVYGTKRPDKSLIDYGQAVMAASELGDGEDSAREVYGESPPPIAEVPNEIELPAADAGITEVEPPESPPITTTS